MELACDLTALRRVGVGTMLELWGFAASISLAQGKVPVRPLMVVLWLLAVPQHPPLAVRRVFVKALGSGERRAAVSLV